MCDYSWNATLISTETAVEQHANPYQTTSSSFSRHAARLCNDNYDPAKAWSDRVDSGPPLILTACPQPRPVLPPGADLHRKQWVKLNRLRCGNARVGDTLQLWGVQESATCACGNITQSVQHVVVDCMIHKDP